MIIGKVTGTVVTTISHAHYKHRRLLVVEPLYMEGDKPGADFVALSVLGVDHCERNGHHYNYGLSMLAEKERRR